MGLDYPTLAELVEQARAEMQTQLPSVDPTVKGSWARAFVDGSAVMAQIVSYLVRDLEQQLFPQTATGDFLDIWGEYEGLERLADETDSEYRDRILLSRSIISGVFTPGQIELAARSISGNSRVFVKKPTLSVCSGATGDADNPVPGQVSVFILRDDGALTQTIIDATREAIISDGAMPSEMSETDLFVQAPTEIETDFTFSALSPDTTTMRLAVQAQLDAFFADTVDFETDITEAAYLGAIQSTQDPDTGQFMISFSLSSPSGTISVGDGEIATLGDVTFA